MRLNNKYHTRADNSIAVSQKKAPDRAMMTSCARCDTTTHKKAIEGPNASSPQPTSSGKSGVPIKFFACRGQAWTIGEREERGASPKLLLPPDCG